MPNGGKPGIVKDPAITREFANIIQDFVLTTPLAAMGDREIRRVSHKMVHWLARTARRKHIRRIRARRRARARNRSQVNNWNG